jgi:hypothetical protein
VHGQKLQWADSQRTADGLARLLHWLNAGIDRKDRSVVGDIADLYINCSMLRTVIDQLLQTPRTTKNLPLIRKRVAKLWARVDNLGSITRDLIGPLDRLHSALYRRRPVDNRKEQPSAGKRHAPRRSR